MRVQGKRQSTSPASPRADQGEVNTELGLERIVFFSDAVMAIALTLLAIDLRVPQVSLAAAPTELPQQLVNMAPRFLSFIVSFGVIGIYWVSHHRYFGFIKRFDNLLIVLDLLFLLFIVLMPFSASLLGEYPALPLSVMAYALNVGAIGLVLCVLWAYAAHNKRFVDGNLDPRLIRRMQLRALSGPCVFFASVPFALISPLWAIVVWCAGTVLSMLLLRLNRRVDLKGNLA
jgi:uncharacterized membrane protein